MLYKFYQADVFTDRNFGGNPLAVFVDASGLDAGSMQSIAREMNHSETTFVFPSTVRGADFDVRIFTPGKEIPFAGHPTLGTAFVLLETGRIPKDRNQVRLNFNSGVIPVTVDAPTGEYFMHQPLPQFISQFNSPSALAESLGLPENKIDSRFPPQVVSAGFPALYVPIRSLESMQSISLNYAKLKEILNSLNVDMLYAFTLETQHPGSTVHVRSFAPFIGIPEDPATGSAAGGLGAYLAKYEVLDPGNLKDIVIEQGYEMKRPSALKVVIEQKAGEITQVRVGGKSKMVIEGQLNLDPSGKG